MPALAEQPAEDEGVEAPAASNPARSKASGAPTLATTTSKVAVTSPMGVDTTWIRSATAFRSAFSRVASSAAWSTSRATTVDAPRSAAPMARAPLPQPTSRTDDPRRTRSAIAASAKVVDGCEPVPKARPASSTSSTTT
ncbi:MAG TPA: hypothetical protein VM143_02615 [Acidimicrobiales bacterium]|nr:hypothetical protein [Acidimicrobiales bacterium]